MEFSLDHQLIKQTQRHIINYESLADNLGLFLFLYEIFILFTAIVFYLIIKYLYIYYQPLKVLFSKAYSRPLSLVAFSLFFN